MMDVDPLIPSSTGIVVVGNGPSSLILSYILEGNIPFYDPYTKFGRHPDNHLHNLLMAYSYHDNLTTELNNLIPPSLLDAVSDKSIINHISAQNSSFSSFVLPINLLLDRLICSDELQYASFESKQTRIKWANFKSKLPKTEGENNNTMSDIPYVIMGSNKIQGGQWSSEVSNDNPHERSLSYAEMLSLPGYSLTEYFQDQTNCERRQSSFTTFLRPEREDISDYYHQYCQKQRLTKHSFSSIIVVSIDTCKSNCDLFITTYYDLINRRHGYIISKYVVLASGIFEKPPLANLDSVAEEKSVFLNPVYYNQQENIINIRKLIEDGQNGYYKLKKLANEGKLLDTDNNEPVDLIIGSGLSAAESIAHYFELDDDSINNTTNTTPVAKADSIPAEIDRAQSLIHVFKWSDDFSSPLRGFSKELYPEYSFVFRLMKQSIKSLTKFKRAVSSQFTATAPKLSQHYQAIPNSIPLEIDLNNNTVKIQIPSASLGDAERDENCFIIRRIKSVRLCIGRSGSLEYLSPSYIKKLDALSETASKAVSSIALGNNSSCTSIRQSPNIITKNTLKLIILGGNEKFFINEMRKSGILSASVMDNFSETSSSSAIHPLHTPPNTRANTLFSTRNSTNSNPILLSRDENDCFSTNLEILPRIFVIGSLTGDTLVRFLLGGCIYVSSKIFEYEGLKRASVETM
ncbi:hypothetical protein NADFUDRAFT_51773 [Nadsonia fulvescens var. elongata DSM 6958]|uniref:FAD/NAD(P)-binding domain-containing protein n=1 Tax=Nadsonia fulvescens var. elongata DSM 6958 TaxID=857566 RepID=A0A1E3PIJ2_9ASCO|nr:hypothetical protein NADFUDRAFT_51773 [Nadsonia fulvescens var. elongata DSM 6958]